MRVSFIGSSLVSSHWNGAATYYRGLLRALAARGHAIRFFEPDAYERQQNRDMADPPWAEVVVWPATAEGLSRLGAQVLPCDMLIKASGVGVFDAELEAMVLGLRRPGMMVAFWDVDAPATLDRVAHDPADPFSTLIPRYDMIFVYGGGAPVVTAYERLGAKACIPIYNALDPETHHPAPPEPAFTADLGFLGNRMPDREARVGTFFLEPAARLPEQRFLLGGAGWEQGTLPANVRAIGHVPTAAHNSFNTSCRAVLNISRASMARYGFSPATRIFEAAGAGACIITDAWEGIEEFLEPGREILVAHGGDEVCAHLAALTPKRAQAIGAAARARVLQRHTYTQRAALWDGIVGGEGRASDAA